MTLLRSLEKVQGSLENRSLQDCKKGRSFEGLSPSKRSGGFIPGVRNFEGSPPFRFSALTNVFTRVSAPEFEAAAGAKRSLSSLFKLPLK